MKFNKVLVAEDTDSINFGIVAKLESIGINNIEHVQFCHDAHLKIKKALFDKEPYELLISDLSFVNPRGKSKLNSGEDLIAAAKEIQPNLKIIAFSVIDKQTVIQNLLNNLEVDAYVCKGLNGLKELENAIECIAQNKKFKCPIAAAVLKQKNIFTLSVYEQKLLKMLANGHKQSEISNNFKLKNITPNSIRSIEANISKLKDTFNAKNSHQLVHMATSLGLI